jgi:transposase InsO family protein
MGREALVVIGWAMGDHVRAELVCDAFRMAIENRRSAPGVTSSAVLRRRRRRKRLRVTETRVHSLPTTSDAYAHVSDGLRYSQAFFNRRPVHSSTGYPTPADMKT